ncbi:hypothetical protein ESY86_04680 [Subsaximicrobium wynnwilliamsii]|uniref:Uncharacterized protein n=1 Tax=Subsaximicrobium wynnwilliamsii TaxID=291179 RepID=A0A5C6ZIQ3_9FLAO|nr:hypothetical protein [Subsaximicrobium wynnwilliamsii]TXD84373.1 hypothetical protein ESY87_04460 [Subsaximicrobium wynnwilliamsii]TXD90054.1 hypothetical protein ESY86_04680 [Subsaximicrobium wynnwilliamsii]TXE04106.1 hypothetical protein ESY88_04455 [Subsaximicrobium wynnwilliamsii]
MQKLTFLIFGLIILTSCSSEKERDPFEVGKTYVGSLTDSTQVKDLELIFPNDSIVTFTNINGINRQNAEIDIYDSSGKKLLELTPKTRQDSTAMIKSVQFFDQRFKTTKNISTLSTFKDIQEQYKISSINNLIRTVVISVNEINASFTIDKSELPANLRFDMDLKIDAVQIPDNAKIKYFMVHW